jgi:hypothetical protein
MNRNTIETTINKVTIDFPNLFNEYFNILASPPLSFNMQESKGYKIAYLAPYWHYFLFGSCF